MKFCIGHRIAVFLLFSLLLLLLFGTQDIGYAFAEFGCKSARKGMRLTDILFLVPLLLALLSAIVPVTWLMYLVGVLLIPYAILSLVLLFVAPPFGIPGGIVFGVWYSYLVAFRRHLRRGG